MTSQLNNPQTWDTWWKVSHDFHLYHPGARHRRRLIRKKIEAFIALNNRPLRLLEVGCGDGLLLGELQSAFHQIGTFTGADFSTDALEVAAKHYPEFTFHNLNIESERLPELFDIVICSEVIEHLSHRDEAFGNLTHMVAPHGILIVTTPTGPIFPTEVFFGHTTHSSRKEFEFFGQNNHLHCDEIISWGWPFYNLLKIATNLMPKHNLQAFGFRPYRWWQKLVTKILFFINYANFSRIPWGYQLIGVFIK